MSSLGYTLLTLGGESKELASLEFFKGGTIGSTNRKGVTTIVNGEYTFYLTENSLSYRFKAKGARVSKPIKELGTFADLDKLTVSLVESAKEVTAEIAATTTNTANKAKEEKFMSKLNMNGTAIEIPQDLFNTMKKYGVRGANVEVAALEAAIEKATGEDKAKMEAFMETAYAEYQAATNAGKGEEKVEPPETPETKVETPEQKPEEKPASGDPLVADVFNTGKPGGGGTGAPANTNGPKVVKTPEQRAAERRARIASETQSLSSQTGKIEALYKQTTEVSDGNESLNALRKMVLINGNIPLFRTLVASDTRLKADTINHVAPKDRKYHENLRGKPNHTSTGAEIKLKYSELDLSLHLVESNPSQPSALFIYVPEQILEFQVSKLSQKSEREMLLDALETFDPSKPRVIKFISKADAIVLSTLLDAPYKIYLKDSNTFDQKAPWIKAMPTLSAKTGAYVYSLKARNADDTTTKLSIRYFIPLSTHLTTTLGAENFKPELLSSALFDRLLFTESDNTNATKFSQLRPDSAARFTQTPQGNYVYNSFMNLETVKAYDSSKDRESFVEMPLPLVELSTPATAGATPRPQFKKARHTDQGYAAKYMLDRDAVGAQITKQRKQTNKSRINENSETIARLELVNRLYRGEAIPTK